MGPLGGLPRASAAPQDIPLVARDEGRCCVWRTVGCAARGDGILLGMPAGECRTRAEGQCSGASTAVTGYGFIMSHVV